MKKVLITGVAGFIGFHLASALKKAGHFVVGIDNFNNYYAPELKRDRALLLASKGIEVHEGDICQPNFVKEVLDKEEATHLVHLAAQAGVRYSITHPEAYLKANIEGFLHILEACKHFSQMKLVYASSSSVYGLNTKVPFSIEDRTDHPANFYGVTKKTKELMASTYHHLYGIDSVGLRFFTVYGPWGRPDMAYFSFTKAILEGKPINLYNYGNMVRDFTYIDDIIDGVISSLDLERGSFFFNLGNHKPESVNTLIELIEQATGKRAIKNLLPKPEGEIIETYADITASQKYLDFSPKTNLAQGMTQFIAWYQQYYNDKNLSFS